MKLNEILNRKVNYEVLKKTEHEFQTAARIGERSIIFTAHYDEDFEFWEVEFKEVSKKKPGGTFDKTNSGNELEVFSMVKDSLQQLIAEYEPDEIAFSASKTEDKDNRADVYERLMKKFKVPGYSVTRKNLQDGGFGYAEFTLVKDDK